MQGEMDVSDQLRALAASPSGKSPWYPSDLGHESEVPSTLDPALEEGECMLHIASPHKIIQTDHNEKG
jgi:hypothetical protein